jgi:hypothetical protein
MRTWEKGGARTGEASLRSSSATTFSNTCFKDQETREEAREQVRGVGRLKRRTAYWLAWSLGILCGALLAFTLLLFAVNRSYPGVDVWGPWVQETVAAVTFPALGLLILSHRPRHPIGWLFCGAGLAGGLDHFFGEYAIYALQARPGTLPGGEVSAWIVSWMWVPFNALLVYVRCCSPTVGRLLSAGIPWPGSSGSRRWRRSPWRRCCPYRCAMSAP